MLDADFPTNLMEFQDRFGDEEECIAYLYKKRWPGGFVCPKCASTYGYSLTARPVFECASCSYQCSLTAGTMFHGTRKPLTMWFRAIFDAPGQLEAFIVAVAGVGGALHDVQIRSDKDKSQPRRISATLQFAESSSTTTTIHALEKICESSGVKLYQVRHSKPAAAFSRREGTSPNRPKSQQVSVSFSDTAIAEVIDSIAQLVKANVILAPEVKGSISLRLKDVPWRSALRAAALTLGFVVVELDDNILMVTTRAAAEVMQNGKNKGR